MRIKEAHETSRLRIKKLQPMKTYSRRDRLKSADDSDDLDGVPNLVTLTYLELNALNGLCGLRLVQVA